MDSAIRSPVVCLPSAPGVYRFRDQAGRVLYIGRAAARRHLAQTPPAWTDFVARAAELAARLRTCAG